jgi:hypothetical protein
MKTAAQLDREIAEALSGEHYYFKIDRRGHRTIYGPFETRKDAEYAGYFAKPVADRDSEGAKGLLHVYFLRGVERYHPDEIKVFSRDPEEYGMKSFKLRLGAPPIHPSWRKLDKEFREELRDKDYDVYQRNFLQKIR